jgi:hypothetical protein
MALPVLAQTPGLIGHLAASVLSVPLIPLIWMVLFLVAGWSWRVRPGQREIVHLKDMYESDRVVKLVSRAQWATLAILSLTGMSYLIFLNHHLSHH